MNIAKLKYEIDSRDAANAAKDLDKQSKSAKTAERGQEKLGKTSKVTGGKVAAANANIARSSGKAGAAMASMRKLGVGMFLAIGAAATAFIATMGTKFISATSEAQDAQAQLAAAIKSTGGAAGQTLVSLNAHAAALQQVTRYGDETTNAAQGVLLTFTKIGGPQFARATEAVLDVATALKTDLKSAAIQVGKALNDPVLGMSALSRSGITFSEAQKEAVKQMVATNNIAGAQTLILKELETQFGGSARAARLTLGGSIDAVRNSFGDLFELTGVGVSYLTGSFERLSGVLSNPVFVGFVNIIGNLLVGAIGLVVDAINLLIGTLNTVIEVLGWIGRTGLSIFSKLAEWAGVSAEDQAKAWEFVKGSARDAFNFIVGAGVGAYDAVIAVWSSLPETIGDVFFQAVNKSIEGINYLVDKTIDGINKLISLANKIPTVNIPTLGKSGGGLGDVSNPYEGAASKSGALISGAFDNALSQDYLGTVSALNKTLGETTKLATAASGALGSAANDNVDPWKDMRTAVNDNNEALSYSRELAGGFFADLQSGLDQGKVIWESFGNAALNVLTKIKDKILNEVLDAVFQVNKGASSFGSGAGGSAGGFLSKIVGSLFGGGGGGIPSLGQVGLFANGGIAAYGKEIPTFARGGVSNSAAIFGEAGPEAAVPLPDGRRIPVDLRGAANSNVVVNIINNSNTKIEKRERQTSGGKTLDIIVGEMMTGQATKQGSDFRGAMQNQYGLAGGLARR